MDDAERAQPPADHPDERGWMVWDSALVKYDFGPLHPMNPLRLQLTHDLALSLIHI